MQTLNSAGVASEKIPLNGVDTHVGARVRARRKILQMSEEWLADHLQISVSHLCDLEEGRARVSFETQHALCRLLDVADRYFYRDLSNPVPQLPRGRNFWVRDVDRWFRDHVSPHEGLFLSVARRLTGNLDTARDLVHDAYSAVLAGDRWRSVENPRAFVSKAITNLALTGLQRQKVVPMESYSDMEASAFADPSPDACQSLSDKERLAVVLGAVNKLTGQCRQVFIMRRIEDIPPQEIAARLGIAVKTVQSHLSRGMVELHKHLENHSKRTDLKLWIATRADSGDTAGVAKDTKR